MPLLFFVISVIVSHTKLFIRELGSFRCNVGLLYFFQLTNPQLADATCLVFEEPNDEFYDLNKDGSLENLGALHPNRLRFIRKLHVVVESDNMGYIACHGACPHY